MYARASEMSIDELVRALAKHPEQRTLVPKAYSSTKDNLILNFIMKLFAFRIQLKRGSPRPKLSL